MKFIRILGKLDMKNITLRELVSAGPRINFLQVCNHEVPFLFIMNLSLQPSYESQLGSEFATSLLNC